MEVYSSFRCLQREMHFSTYRIRKKLKLETIVHQNIAQIAVFEKNGKRNRSLRIL